MIWFLFSLVAVLIIVPLARHVALRFGFVDIPGGRKQHKEPIPPIGGLVIFTVLFVIQALRGDIVENWALYTGLAALLVIGAWDDRTDVNAWVKFIIQIAVAFLVVLYGECRIENLGNMFGFGNLYLGFMSIPFSVAAVALLINAINLMDGLDGLAGGQSFLILAILAVISGLNPELLPILGALAGFLYYNMRSPWRARASIFLGDAGTLALGLTLAWYAISLANDPSVTLEPISVAWILAVPIMDECAQFYRRVREGRHPFSPDRGHLHHHFRDAGFSPEQATTSILMISTSLGLAGYALAILGVPLVILTLAWMITILTHMHLNDKKDFYVPKLLALKSRASRQAPRS
jgi:UDP-GlcNAc:undecaprenyl-phosphate GlcNAc-1-phosphate transferase